MKLKVKVIASSDQRKYDHVIFRLADDVNNDNAHEVNVSDLGFFINVREPEERDSFKVGDVFELSLDKVSG